MTFKLTYSGNNETDVLNDLLYVKRDAGYGGWRVALLTNSALCKSEERLLICVGCRGLLREASVIAKGNKHELKCSACVSQQEKSAVQPAMTNREVINERQVDCPVKACGWSERLDQLKGHLEGCALLRIPCPLGCISPQQEGDNGMCRVTRIERREMEVHKREVCPMRLVSCEFCARRVRACGVNAHLEECEEFVVVCPNKCKGMGGVNQLKRRELVHHLDRVCPFQKVECCNCGVVWKGDT